MSDRRDAGRRMTDPSWGDKFDPATMTLVAWIMAGLFVAAVTLGFVV